MFSKLAILSVAAITTNAVSLQADNLVSVGKIIPDPVDKPVPVGKIIPDPVPNHQVQFMKSLNDQASWDAYRAANKKVMDERKGLR